MTNPGAAKGPAMVGQAVVLLVDGIHPDVLRSLLAAGELPSIERLFPGARVHLATSVFPTTTGPAHLPFLTGRYPGPCNVPGIRWFDPARYATTWFSASRYRSYIGPGALLAGYDIAPGVQTLFDLVRDHAQAGGNVRKGLRASRDLARWSKLAEPAASFFTERWDRLDDRVAAAAATAVASGTRLVFAVFSAADSMAHKFGPFAEQTRLAYRRIDRSLAPLADVVTGGTGDTPFVLLVSDHGASPTHTHLDLEDLVERAVGRCFAHPRTWRWPAGARSAVMVSGNAMAHLYMRQGRWQPVYLDDAPDAVATLLESLLREEAIDQVFGRTVDGGAMVLSRHGEARLRVQGGGIAYRVVQGRDPFGYPPGITGVDDAAGWLARTWDSDYPDAPVQVLQILESPRAGHLVVTARPGHDLRSRFEKPPHRGSHGSLHRDHMMTPLLSNRPLSRGPDAAGRARTVDVCPTVLDALGVLVPDGLDGRSLWPDVSLFNRGSR
jgi:hypothetical protein